MLSTVSLLLICTVTSGQEGTVNRVLEELIERTNGLESFHVVYDVERSVDGTEVASSAELVFEAPDIAHMRFSRGGEASELWLFGAGVYILGLEGVWMRAPLPDIPEYRTALDDLFPPDAVTLAPGVSFDLELRHRPVEGEHSVGFKLVPSPLGREALLAWLPEWRRGAEWVELVGDELVMRVETLDFRLSTEHGFPTFIENETEQGERVVLRLRECSVNELLEDALVRLPRAARDAAISPDLAGSLEAAYSISAVRQAALQRVSRRLRDGELTWDSDTRDDWSAFQRELHTQHIEGGVAPVVEDREVWIDEIATMVHEAGEDHENDRAWEKLVQMIGYLRAALSAALGLHLEDYLDKLPTVDLADAELEQLLEAEEAVVTELFHELLIAPVLERFDEAIDIDSLRELREGADSLTPRRLRLIPR